MDFVKKKAFEAQLNKAGLGSLAKPFTGASASNDNNAAWSLFRYQDSDNTDLPDVEVELFPIAVASAFDTKPKNFPKFVHLFYVDRTILSDAAANPVRWALYTLSLMETLLWFNTFVAILFTALYDGKGWLNLLLSAILTILLTFCELVSYETAFRGAYRTSSNLRQRYLYFCTANIIIIALYTFLAVSFFNGWARIPNINADPEEKHTALRRALAIFEALGWTLLLFVQTFTLFEYYHLYKGREQGLSPSALDAVTNAPSLDNVEFRDERPADPNRARVQEIRERYGIPEGA